MATENPIRDMYRRELADEVEKRRERIAVATKELHELEDILRTLGGPLAPVPFDDIANESIPARRRASARHEPQPVERFYRSIPELVVDILRRAPQGLYAPQIIAELRSLRPGTAASSVYPSLIKMSSAGTIRRTGSGRAALYQPPQEDTP